MKSVRTRQALAERARGISPFVVKADMFVGKFDSTAPVPLSNQRKRDLLDYFDSNVDELDRWRKINAAYHEDDYKFMRFLVPPGKRVLELGCGRGDLLAALQPSFGVGVDFGAATLARAKARHPGLHFVP